LIRLTNFFSSSIAKGRSCFDDRSKIRKENYKEGRTISVKTESRNEVAQATNIPGKRVKKNLTDNRFKIKDC
jgi:hypothetical protein